jgi:molybdopterin-guanine dinucleotide biosynthesis protein B
LHARPDRSAPILGFAAWSGTGKTTLLKSLIPELRRRGIRVGLMKHAHHGFEIDHPGKDSYELRHAGASPVLVTSSRRRALVTERPEPRDPVLEEELAHFDSRGVDLILVEGFRDAAIPKIVLYRRGHAEGRPSLHDEDVNVVAVATDDPAAAEGGVPVLDINDPAAVAEFIVRDFLGKAA